MLISTLNISGWKRWLLVILVYLAVFFSMIFLEFPIYAVLILSISVFLISLRLYKIIVLSPNKWIVLLHLSLPLLLVWPIIKRDMNIPTSQAFALSLLIAISIVVLVQFSFGFQSGLLKFIIHSSFLLAIFILFGLIAFSDAFDLSADQNTKRSALLMIELPFFYLVYLYANDNIREVIADFKSEIRYVITLILFCAPFFLILGYI